MNFDPKLTLQMCIGVTGIPMIQQFVEWLKDRWGLSTKLTPPAAVITGVLINVVVGYLLSYNLLVSLEYGLIAGFGAGAWHEVTK